MELGRVAEKIFQPHKRKEGDKEDSCNTYERGGQGIVLKIWLREQHGKYLSVKGNYWRNASTKPRGHTFLNKLNLLINFQTQTRCLRGRGRERLKNRTTGMTRDAGQQTPGKRGSTDELGGAGGGDEK